MRTRTFGLLLDEPDTGWPAPQFASSVHADEVTARGGFAEGEADPLDLGPEGGSPDLPPADHGLDLPDPDPIGEPAAPAEPGLPAAAPLADGPRSISFSQILQDRPDVFRAFYETYYGAENDRRSEAWAQRVGGDTPEAYAKYWYEHYGRYEGYNQGAVTAGDNVSVEQILQDRPDVLRAFYEEYYGPGNDRNSDAWVKRVGGDTPEAYAKYWYDKYGRWEGYSQTDKAAAESIDCERLLVERPDVFRAFYEEYYGSNNDRKSPAWVDRVGGDTVQDYAKYWYTTYGRHEGYTQRPPGESAGAPAEEEPAAETPPLVLPNDPSLDPWNHPAIYPDWTPPYPGWTPPDAVSREETALPDPPTDLLAVGRSLVGPEIFG